jgi:DegV family protein with EDD domain
MTTQNLTLSCDSTADLSPELYARYKIELVPLGIVIGDKLYNEGIDITPDDIYNAVEKLNIMPKSNAAMEVDYDAMFTKNTAPNSHHIHFSLSGKLSASHSNAVRAAAKFKNVTVIDSKNLSAGTGILAMKAREMHESGMSVPEVIAEVTDLVGRLNCSFVIDTLKYLHRGGRVSGFKLLGANILKIHPQLVMDREGYLVQGKRFKGNYASVVREYVKYMLDANPNADKDMCFVTHTTIDPAIAKAAIADMQAAGFKRIFNTIAGSVITTHCGRGTIGILFCEKKNR